MVNFGLNPASLLGIFLAVAGAGLYYLRTIRPELSRDHDIFFAAISLLCGFILLFQGWRLDPILLFGQFLLTGSAIFFAYESIRMRGVATDQAKRNTPIVDDDRRVSREYQYQAAELEELEPYEEEPPNRRLKGTADRRSSRTNDYEEDVRSRPPRRSSNERLGPGTRTSKSRPRREERPTKQVDDAWGTQAEDEWDTPRRSNNDDWSNSSNDVAKKPRRPSSSGSSYGSEERNSETAPKQKRKRPRPDPMSESSTDVAATPTDYVEYRPIDYPDEDRDNSGNFEY